MTGAEHTSKSAPFSVRLTASERARLEECAGSLPLGTYIRGRLLADRAEARRHRLRAPLKDQEALARALGIIGQSGLSENLKQIASAAKIGALPISPETEQDILRACADIQVMRIALLRALGLRGGAGS